ncbi:MAG: HEAT repeat domain-containing protein, partial [Actinomycetota bacterium]|nr:HEAT repeat domain-containing protein [Actinomycetota bacterium]
MPVVELAVIVLLICSASLALTTALSVAMRTTGGLAARRLGTYRAAVSAQLTSFLVGAEDEPPPPPRGRMQQGVMCDLMLSIGSNLRGEAAERVAALFRAYGLVDPARRDLRAHQSLTRIRAAEALGAMGVQDAVPWLQEGLVHEDHQLRFACSRSLSALGAVGMIADVDAALGEDESALGERIDVLVGFGPASIPHLIGHLAEDRSSRQRWLAAEALGELRAAEAVPALVRALDAGDDEFAARGARALGRIGEGSSASALARTVASERPWFVRAAATTALGAVGGPHGAEMLVNALSAERWEIRDAAARGLAAHDNHGIDAVTARMDTLADDAVAHFIGACDVTGQLDRIIARGADGDPGCDALVRRALRAG